MGVLLSTQLSARCFLKVDGGQLCRVVLLYLLHLFTLHTFPPASGHIYCRPFPHPWELLSNRGVASVYGGRGSTIGSKMTLIRIVSRFVRSRPRNRIA